MCQIPRGLSDNNVDFSNLAFSPDAKILVTGSEDGSTALWKIEDRQLSFIKEMHHSHRALAFLPNGKTVITDGNEMQLWNSFTGELLAQL